MIASIRGKKPHVYRVIILKQIADHTSGRLPLQLPTVIHQVELIILHKSENEFQFSEGSSFENYQ